MVSDICSIRKDRGYFSCELGQAEKPRCEVARHVCAGVRGLVRKIKKGGGRQVYIGGCVGGVMEGDHWEGVI